MDFTKCFSGVLEVVEYGNKVISAAKQPESPTSIFGTSFFLREMMNSLRGTNKLAITGNMNSTLKGTKLGLGNMNFLMGIDTVLQEIIDSELKTNSTVGSIIMVNTDIGFFDCYARG